MICFEHELKELQQISALMEAKKAPGAYEVSGAIDSVKAQLTSVLSKETKKSTLIVTYSDVRARELLEDIQVYDSEALLLPAKDMLFYGADLKSNAIAIERMQVLKAILRRPRVTVVCTVDALLNKLIPREVMDRHLITLKVGEDIDLEELLKRLHGFGYLRTSQVMHPGEYARRGGILDVYPITAADPVRIELWDTEIDTIRSFDTESQLSRGQLDEITIHPAREAMIEKAKLDAGIRQIRADAEGRIESLRKDMHTEEAYRLKGELEKLQKGADDLDELPDYESYLPYFYKELSSVLDYFAPDDLEVYMDEYPRVKEQGDGLFKEFRESMAYRLEKGYVIEKQTDMLFSPAQVRRKLASFPMILLSTLSGRTDGVTIKESFRVEARSVSAYNGSMDLLVKELSEYKKRGMIVVLVSPSASRASRIAKDLLDLGINAFYTDNQDAEGTAGTVMVTYGKLREGFVYPDAGVAMISESDIFGKRVRKKRIRKYEGGEHISSFSDLHIGDYVVHENHGVGVYKGIEQIAVDKTKKDYIKIEYAKGATLYILATQLEMIQKYSSKEGAAPKLHQLGGPEWKKTKERVKVATEAIAEDLVELYASRSRGKGYAFSKDTPWQQEFEEAFPFEETDCQLTAIDAVKSDMQSTRIMDRLVCGDVGFGKTEVAIRAAFKAVQDGMQVAVLAPTTILADQHYHTFVERMKNYPIKIGLMCRLRTDTENKQTAKDVVSGKVDIVVGTHRLLSSDVNYKKLGLLIIDEEQRFGVAHKEKIKKLRENVDVLAMTATPIPRTLHMSLIGIRDMSLLQEAPAERMPVQTYVMEFDEEMVREAISRELARGGQVYYVHNKIRDIADVVVRLEQLLPEVSIAYAHGQMDQRRLEDIMYRFVNGEIDVLVSTTIVEIGLDIPNANTIIIQDAENFGLSQLYQLRGRVGRSNRNAYAFLMYKRGKMLKEEAEKRLSAIRQFTELGSGFQIAMRDLEIRGAGNLLGEAQSGHMEAVGYDLYCKMLSEAVGRAKGEDVKASFETTMDLVLDAFIPGYYIEDEFQKIDIYKRIALLSTEDEIAELKDELVDRFGEYPACVENLFLITSLKIMAHDCWFTEVKARGEEVNVTFHPQAVINNEGLFKLISDYQGYVNFFPKYDPPKMVYTVYKNSRDRSVPLLQKITQFLEDCHRELVPVEAPSEVDKTGE